MKKLLLSLLLLTACGDDLGWEHKETKHDCADAVVGDSGVCNLCQDVTETKDEQSGTEEVVSDVADSTQSDVLADSGSDDADVSVPDGVTGTDTEDTQDAQDVPEDVTQDVAPPPECVTATDCVVIALPCVAPDCQEGKCVKVPFDTPCSDNNECTAGDQCQLGVCVAGIEINCDDLESCTLDSCEADKGCVHLPVDATCVDGDGCTAEDVCKDGKCVGGKPFNCDDGNVCTDDTCETFGKDEIHVCNHLPNQATCTDNDACTLDDACEGVVCKSKAVAICDDNNVCTDNTCDPANGCVYLSNVAVCTDNDACTVDDKCFENACKSGSLLSCADNNECTTDLCKPESGCYFDNNTNVCSDNNVCSIDDKCEAGSCIAGAQKVCDDANLCTVDSCDAVNGCASVNAVNGAKCAEGVCKDGSCACVSGFGCALPAFVYTGDVTAGMLGGMGGGVGPKMGCPATDVLIGLGFDFSNGQKTATRTTAVCGKVTIEQNGTVITTQTTTQKSGGSGCFGWDPSTPTPLVVCKSGWAVVGIKGKKPGGTLFNSVKVVCGKLDVAGKPTGETEVLNVEGTLGSGVDQEVLCPEKTIARYFETRAGCGQDALTMYCATATPDCTGQELICKDL